MTTKKVMVPLLLGAASYLCAGGSPTTSSVSSPYLSGSSSSSGEVSRPSQRYHSVRRLQHGDELHRSASAPGELGMIAEVPGLVPDTARRQPKFLTPTPSPCKTVYVDELKEEIATVRKELIDFKEGLLEGNGRSHSFEVPDETVAKAWRVYRHFACFVGQVKQCQQECIQKKGPLPACCSDQKIFDNAEKETRHAKEDFNLLTENRPGAPKKTLGMVVAKIDAELADLDKLDIYLEELQRRSICCQQQLAKKSLWQRLFACWPKKKKAGSNVETFEGEAICEDD